MATPRFELSSRVQEWWRGYERPNETTRDRWVMDQARRLVPGTRVLDVGAGPCRYRPLFSHCEYQSQDFAAHEGHPEGPLADRGEWKYGDLDYICDASAIPVADASFDVVLCTEVLEHVPEPEHVVREVARLLRPGGVVLLSAPLGSGLHQEPHHFYGGFTPHWYWRVLRNAGFEQITVTANGGFFSFYAQESRRFSTWIDPRRLPLLPALVMFPFWVVTLMWFRVLFPLLCRWLDQFDTYRAFTVGYHVRAIKATAAIPAIQRVAHVTSSAAS